MSYWHSYTDEILKINVEIEINEIKKENNVKSYDMNVDIQKNKTKKKQVNSLTEHSPYTQ